MVFILLPIKRRRILTALDVAANGSLNELLSAFISELHAAARVGRAKLEAGDFPAFALFASKAFIKTPFAVPSSSQNRQTFVAKCVRLSKLTCLHSCD